jgi:hypothetical protein
VSWRVELAAVRSCVYERNAACCPSAATSCLLCGHPVTDPWQHVVQLDEFEDDDES